jgi:hypothetical protein
MHPAAAAAGSRRIGGARDCRFNRHGGPPD